ncbi:L-fucose mutarotase [Oribacterium sp. oral taxon 102]|uniref:RbsD/FucU family protein n=1 Tax=Oribacterium sp. oral taxon 102 TaxID=671214 RepID=UPI0015C06BF7|nr:RbsD/FucU domain-containing protein [Oribacterium sp. oral taxon 102]NWO21020.1 L-fucose mutarotase [Oribacterium sp. oral taxon 102]
MSYLKGIPSNISSDLLKALADMGHGDLLVIADHFYPPHSKTPNGIMVDAKGCGAAEIIDSILKLMPLDIEYEAHPVEYMVPDADSGMHIEKQRVWEDAIVAVENNGYKREIVSAIERSRFYEKAGRAFLTVCTSEVQPYGCFLMQKGVM